MAALEVPLANPIGSPKQVLAEYYYKIPVRKIYKQYPVYAPGREPAGYLSWLKKQEPVLLWDDTGQKPQLKTEADWIKAGETVFSAPIFSEAGDDGVIALADVRDTDWYQKGAVPLTKDGVIPFVHYVIRERERLSWVHFPAPCATRASCPMARQSREPREIFPLNEPQNIRRDHSLRRPSYISSSRLCTARRG
jgi:hypothetical protein